jgi:hypothetical protein
VTGETQSVVRQILKMSDVVIVSGGTIVEFTIETSAGNERFAIPTGDVGNVLQFFASLASATDDGSEGLPTDLFPIELKGLGYQEGETPDTCILVAKIGATALGLEIPRSELAASAQKMLLMASQSPGSSN